MPNGRKANKRRCFTAKVEDQVIYSMISTQCFIVRTELLRLLGGWNEDLMAWQDWNTYFDADTENCLDKETCIGENT